MRFPLILLFVLLCIAGCGHGEDFNGDRPDDPSRTVGIACESDADCEQHCIEDKREFPGGFCTILGCRQNQDCPDGTVCIATEGGVCLFPCSEPLDCTADFLGRSGFVCRQMSGYNHEDTIRISYKVCIGER